MPARRQAKPVTEMPYGRKGIFPAYAMKEESANLQARNDQLLQEVVDAKISCDMSTVERRNEQRKNEQHILDFDEAKRYMSMKIRDKEQKIRFYENKLKDTRQEHKDLLERLKSEHTQLIQAHELEITQLMNTLKANKQRRDAMATVAALEIQLKREIDEAEQTLKREKAQQSQQTSTALAEYYSLHIRHEKELSDGIEREKAKNRGMTSENLERTVIEMMREIDSEIKKYSALVQEARGIADVNSQLMKLNKQRYMERDLLQQECDAGVAKINKNDIKIRKLVEELKLHDKKLSANMDMSTPDITEEEPIVPPTEEEEEEAVVESEPVQEAPDREAMLNRFFETSVDVLCNSVVKILGNLDPDHAKDYVSFHEVFNTFDGRKKELRFLMSKLGNLTFNTADQYRLPEVGFDDIEGADEEITAKKIVDPQRKAIMEFAEPIAADEFPDLIATHFFQ